MIINIANIIIAFSINPSKLAESNEKKKSHWPHELCVRQSPAPNGDGDHTNNNNKWDYNIHDSIAVRTMCARNCFALRLTLRFVGKLLKCFDFDEQCKKNVSAFAHKKRFCAGNAQCGLNLIGVDLFDLFDTSANISHTAAFNCRRQCMAFGRIRWHQKKHAT